VISLHDKTVIAAFLQRNVALHAYALGDLDDFFWPYTTWYARQDTGQIVAIALLYTGTHVPTLLALGDEPLDSLRELLRSLRRVLPRRVYAHLSGDLATVLEGDYRIEPHGLHARLALTNRRELATVDTSEVSRLSADDLPMLEALYAAAYPGNWFDPRMLATGHYYGIRRGAQIVSVAGVHVYAPQYGVAALGNITTLPELRGQGLGTAVTARLCHELLASVDQISLNVKADNAAAIATDRKLGFEQVASYHECALEALEATDDRRPTTNDE
jgi:ribosomal protein S18 acetylase RimI-like enzyme